MALNPIVYFYARLAHALTPGILNHQCRPRALVSDLRRLRPRFVPPSPKGASLIFKRDRGSERDPYQKAMLAGLLRVSSQRVGCSFQFGRTSILFPRLPHLAQTTRERKYGISVSAG